MHPDIAIELIGEMFWVGLLVCGPLLGLTLLVGLAISILQVVTQVQEVSLTFIPKIITAVITLVILGPWMLKKVMQYASTLIQGIPDMF